MTRAIEIYCNRKRKTPNLREIVTNHYRIINNFIVKLYNNIL